MASDADIEGLRRHAAEVRRSIVRMMGTGKAHHFGGSLSAADIVTALYFYKMRYDAADPRWPERDRFVMSKGHCVPAQYAALAKLGVLPPEELATLKKLGTRLQGHPAMHLTPGIEACTGALGEGLSYANGLALAGRIQGRAYRVYCLLGDGELHEGQVWEAAMTSAKQCLSNVVAIVDRNGLKAMDETACGKELEPLAERWAGFGWATREIDGHDMKQICDALDWTDGQADRPSVIVAKTVKGCGVGFMAGQAGFHNAPIDEQQFVRAMCDLGEEAGEEGL
ncbi:MAG: transketolase [Anaerolineae bacterium]